MTKEKDHGEWFNYVVGTVNCIGFCDMAPRAMMTTVHDPTVKEYIYIDRVKRSGASLKYSKAVESPSMNSTQSAEPAEPAESAESAKDGLERQSDPTKGGQKRQIRKLYALHTYNQYMGGSDNHIKLNSYYLTAINHHQRN